jgi:hypothetical protein
MARKRVGPRVCGPKSLSVPIMGQPGRAIRRCLERLNAVLADEKDGISYYRVSIPSGRTVQDIQNELTTIGYTFPGKGRNGLADGWGIGYVNPISTGAGGKDVLKTIRDRQGSEKRRREDMSGCNVPSEKLSRFRSDLDGTIPAEWYQEWDGRQWDWMTQHYPTVILQWRSVYARGQETGWESPWDVLRDEADSQVRMSLAEISDEILCSLTSEEEDAYFHVPDYEQEAKEIATEHGTESKEYARFLAKVVKETEQDRVDMAVAKAKVLSGKVLGDFVGPPNPYIREVGKENVRKGGETGLTQTSGGFRP